MTNQTRKQPRIGITGTNGKTSTILMLAFILEQCGLKPAALDAWRGKLSCEQFVQNATQHNNDCMLMEVPAEALRQRHISGSIFQACALTNLSLDHLTSYSSPKQYYHAKLRFIHELPAGAKTVIPADDLRALTLTAEGHLDFISFGIHYPHAMVMAKNICTRDFLSSFDLTVQADIETFTGQIIAPGSAPVSLPMAGEHNISNALAAATLALLFNLEIKAVANALSRFPGIRRNMEPIVCNQYRIIDDGARNPQSIRACLTAATTMNHKRILMLHGIYGGAGQTINRCNAHEIAFWLHKNPENQLFITRSMYHSKNRHQVRLGEEKAFLSELKNNNVEFAYYPDLPDACESILSHATEHDLILIVGGPVLNRAREIILQATGEKRASHTLVPMDIPLWHETAYRQAVLVNPT